MFPKDPTPTTGRGRADEKKSPPMTDASVSIMREGDSTSYTLLNRVRVFDPAAWARLVDLYSPLIFRLCRRSGLQPADAADIGQEVFTSVARTITEFRRDRPGDTFRGWLYTITRNKIRTLARKPLPLVPGPTGSFFDLGEIPAPPEDESSVMTEQRYLTRRTLELVRAEVAANTWAAFWRTAVEGESPDDVAAALGISRNAVYLAKARIRKRLKEELASVIDFAAPRFQLPETGESV